MSGFVIDLWLSSSYFNYTLLYITCLMLICFVVVKLKFTVENCVRAMGTSYRIKNVVLSLFRSSKRTDSGVTRTFFSRGVLRQEYFRGGVQQIKLRTYGRENGNLGSVAP
jgi:hypothetical protein